MVDIFRTVPDLPTSTKHARVGKAGNNKERDLHNSPGIYPLPGLDDTEKMQHEMAIKWLSWVALQIQPVVFDSRAAFGEWLQYVTELYSGKRAEKHRPYIPFLFVSTTTY